MTEQRYCKRLIEVDLPIKRISEHARREKSIRHGHISTLHIWWARRPLAACRAVLCASLWPDPVDPLCPDKFKKEAARLMKEFRDKRGGRPKDWTNPIELRNSILDFIADFSDWDNSANKDYMDISAALTVIAHEELCGGQGNRPLVLDSFAGGGSIPLESLRVGAEVFASDLNPVPVLLNKVAVEYVPKYGQMLADEIRKGGEWLKKRAEDALAQFYPKDADGSIPIAYLWARTIKCEGPGCGIEVPLIRSFCLAKRGKTHIGLSLIPDKRAKQIKIEIIQTNSAKEVSGGTVRRTNAVCPCCGYTTPAQSVKRQLKEKRGGATDARMLCVVTTKSGKSGRSYRLPNEKDLLAVRKSAEALKAPEKKRLIPNEQMDQNNSTLVSGRGYGIATWSDLFTDRQLNSLTTIALLLNELEQNIAHGDKEFKVAVKTCLAFVLDKLTDKASSFCRWKSSAEYMAGNTFGRQALPMVFDFCEANLFGGATGDILSEVSWVEEFVRHESVIKNLGTADRHSAVNSPLANDSCSCFFTDPPYYDAIEYGTLSDFFYVWLKRTIGENYPDLFRENLTDKKEECIVSTSAEKDKAYYESTMMKAMAEGRRVLSPSGIGIVVFAHKSTAGWEAQLKSMIEAGWIFTASWPIDTEMSSRMNAMGTASLASSIHLVCRPRENADGSLRRDDIGDWRDILRQLPERLHEWMPKLSQEGVVGADAIFACLGPALEIFSRYSLVEKANGEQVELKEYLEQVWGAVAKEALNMIFKGVHTEGFEEDARLTAMWLWTLSTGSNDIANADAESADDTDENGTVNIKNTGFSLEYDAARKIAQGLGAHLENLSSIIEIDGDQARLLPVAERVKFLFGKGSIASSPGKKKKKENQMTLFEEFNKVEEQGWSLGDEKSSLGKTILDRLHQAMILFGAGRADAMRRFLVEEGVGKDDRFWRLAQAFSALYPSHTDEKRWVDGVLARKKSLGF